MKLETEIEQTENLTWKKMIQIKDKEGNILEIESFRDTLIFYDIESGRTFRINGVDLEVFITLITE